MLKIEGRHRHLTWALVAYALLVQVHPSAITLAPALLLLLLLLRRQVQEKPLFPGILLGAATTLPFLIHQARV